MNFGTKSTDVVGGTRVSRVQFGVPLNCVDARVGGTGQASKSEPHTQTVSGVTPETTRETRVLHNTSVRALANNTVLNQ